MYQNRPLISKRHYVLVDTKFNSLNVKANPTSRWSDILRQHRCLCLVRVQVMPLQRNDWPYQAEYGKEPFLKRVNAKTLKRKIVILSQILFISVCPFLEYSPSFSGIRPKNLSKLFRHAKVTVRDRFFTTPDRQEPAWALSNVLRRKLKK